MKIIRNTVTVCFLLLTSITVASAQSTKPQVWLQQEYEVMVKCVDEDNQLIRGCVIKPSKGLLLAHISPEDTTLEKVGLWEVQFVGTPGELITITATHKGKSLQGQTRYSLLRFTRPIVTVKLYKVKATVRGQVLGKKDQPQKGIVVTATKPDGGIVETTTDENGKFSFPSIVDLGKEVTLTFYSENSKGERKKISSTQFEAGPGSLLLYVPAK